MTPDDFRARIANVTEAIRGHALNPELRSLLEASNATAGFSVDVVHMKDVKGPYHRHPKGEIDLVVPVAPGARFDGQGAGWVVYDPESAHYPTVTDGEAFVLFTPSLNVCVRLSASPKTRWRERRSRAGRGRSGA